MRARVFAPARVPRSTGTARAPSGLSPAVQAGLHSPARALGEPLRSMMEQRFRHDFGQVRLHAGAEATQAARSVDALAFTVGRDVVFGAGQLAPDTEAGRRLLAHELTH